MDFSFSEEQRSIADLAEQILRDQATHERQKEIEQGEGPRFDPKLWAAFAEAGLLGIAVPEEHGGAGLGFLELSAILEQIGRRTAPIPFLETAVLGTLPLVEFGSAEQKRALLPRVVEGRAVLTAALIEADAEASAPTTTAVAEGGAWRLSGTKVCVPAGQLAERMLVPAATGRGAVGVFLVDPKQAEVEPLETTSGQPEARIRLKDLRVEASDVLGDAQGGAAVVAWIRERATAALCSLSLGVCEEALAITAEYIKTRKQFDQPIAMFQAVGQRAADAYVDTEGIRLTSWQAAWRISAGLPAAPQVAAAKIWAADAGQRVVHTAQHLHGGIGVDRDYPLHRYFLYAKQLELTLGGATAQLRALGQLLADSPD
jgi:alkylation response protein AidB-like acyl-CoA dehydrogenase